MPKNPNFGGILSKKRGFKDSWIFSGLTISLLYLKFNLTQGNTDFEAKAR